MKQMKRIVALFLGLIMLFSCIVPVSAANTATLSVGTVEGSAGDRVIVPISIDRNGGFVSLSLSVTYDMSALTLVSVHDTGLIDGGYHSPYYDSPYYLSWENDVRTSNYTVTGVIVELEFLIEEDAQNKDYSIVVRMNSDGALDKDGEEVFFTLNSGKITVAEQEHVCSFGKWDDYNRKKHVRICDECGEREYENHNWNDGEILEEPSCDSDGEILYTCEDCGYEKYDWIDAEPHEYDDWIKYDDEQHMRVCSNCDDEEFAPHDWVQNSNGFVCADCGATRSDAPQPHEHRFVEYFTYRPTCTQQGYTEYRCEDCFESKNDNYVPALGHDYVNGVCDRCDAVDPNPGQIPVTGIKLNKSSATLKVGGSTLLEATITPGNATNRNIIWTVSDPSVVQMNISVSKIYADVIGLAPGTATITAKSEDGAFIAQCVVTVEGDSVPEESFNLVLSAEEAMAGETVDVTVNLSDNPGITSLVFKVHYDLSLLTLTNVTYNTGMGGQTVSPKPLTSPVTLYWVNGLEDYSGNGLFATLTFTVSENAKEGDVAAITVTYNPDDVFNVKEDNVGMNVTAGQITVINYVPGDINGDGIRNNKDVTRFMQYNAGWDVEVNTYALDVNGDGTVSNKDVTRLMQYNAGWDVEIH